MRTMLPDDDDPTILHELGRLWWMFLVVGIGWLVFAWIVLSFKYSTVWAIVVFAGVAFIVGGCSEIAMGLQMQSWRWFYVLLGVASIVAGIVCFVWPEPTFLVMAAILAWYLLIKGLLDIVAAFMTRRADDGWWLTLIAGVVQLMLGFWAIGYDGRSIALLVLWVGAMALFRGAMNIIMAFKVRPFRGGGPTAALA